MKTECNPVIELLAATDALWEPIRDWTDNHRICGLLERREQFRRCGLPVELGGGDAAARKSQERRLDQIETSGLVIFSRRHGKRAFWRLTDQADWALRRLCTWSDYPECLVLMTAVQAHTDCGYTNTGCVPEWRLAVGPHNGDGWTDQEKNKIIELEWIAAPSLSRGWLAAWSDGNGSSGYRLTKSGRRFLKSPASPEIEWPAYSSDANDAYLAALKVARESLRSIASQGSGVAVLLSAGTWPQESKAAPIPPVVGKDGRVCPLATMIRAILKDVRRQKRLARV